MLGKFPAHGAMAYNRVMLWCPHLKLLGTKFILEALNMWLTIVDRTSRNRIGVTNTDMSVWGVITRLQVLISLGTQVVLDLDWVEKEKYIGHRSTRVMAIN